MTAAARSVAEGRVPSFDRSYLPPALLEFVVIADTHHIVDPHMYKAEGDSVTPELTADWSERGDVALAYAKGLEPTLSFHVGDLQQEYPGHESFDAGRRAALRQLADSGLTMRHVAGNMDVGDKPDPTMPAGWVQQEYLDVWHEDLGPSYYSLNEGRFHFVTINSQLLNASLPARRAQREWLEADLEAHVGERTFLFMHIPPFLMQRNEPGLGSYDVIDEPDRGWLLDLLVRYQVEAVFCGHTHFAIFNRIGDTRIYIAPSTTTTRPGFPEALTVVPPSRGWADTAKLGFFLVRLTDDATAVHLVRTSGRTTLPAADRSTVVTRISSELPRSPLGAYLRLPLARQSEGAVVYPYHVRHGVRDDHPLLACVELGLRHVRFPIHDLDSPLQRSRLAVLRDEGVTLTATSIWAPGARLPVHEPGEVDVLEIQMAGTIIPPDDLFAAIGAAAWPSVALAPIVMASADTVHKRSRIGYIPAELVKLDAVLAKRGVRVQRAVCHLDETSVTLWDDVRAFRPELRSIDALDFIVGSRQAGSGSVTALALSMLAAATLPGCRLFIDPLQELDRTAEVMSGLLDRLSNPKPAFEVLRNLNTLLFGVDDDSSAAYRAEELVWDGSRVAEGVSSSRGECWLLVPAHRAGILAALADRWAGDRQIKVIDLGRGESQTSRSIRHLGDLWADDPNAVAIVSSEPG
jgi:hypothetical protein